MSDLSIQQTLSRFAQSAVVGALLAALLWGVVTVLKIDRLSDLLVGGEKHPFTLQNLMWIVFFVGLGELRTRFRQAAAERGEFVAGLLPEDEETVLTQADLPEIYRRAKKRPPALFLPRLLQRIILQFNSSRSIDNANALLNASVDLYMHELELRYNFLRYIMWLIPTLGFIGTMVGITNALDFAGGLENFDKPDFLPNLTAELGVAFYTTLLALLQAAVLVFLLHLAQGEEERALNSSAQYCVDNLINRLYEENRHHEEVGD